MFLGLHSLLFMTKVKATAANMTCYLALFASDSQSSPTGSAGQAAQQLSTADHCEQMDGVQIAVYINGVFEVYLNMVLLR